MNRTAYALLAIAFSTLGCVTSPSSPEAPAAATVVATAHNEETTAPATTAAAASQAPRSLPPLIIANAGQWPAEVEFVARVAGVSTAFHHDRIHVGGAGADDGLSLVFTGASEATRVRGESPQAGRVHYLLGDDPAAWIRDVPTCSTLRYEDLHEGIDLVVHVLDDNLEYDLQLQPGADLESFAVRCEGARGITLDADGALLIKTAGGLLRQRVVAAWQADAAGITEPVACAFRLLDDGDARAPGFGFDCPDRNRDLALVVDPTLQWSTLLGGVVNESIAALAVDGTGSTFVVGGTSSIDFPVTAGAYSTAFTGTNGDGFVAKLNPAGDGIVYATFLGGTATDVFLDIAIDAAGAAYVCGTTYSTNFPVTAGASQPANAGSGDVFVSKLDPSGSTLEYGTYFGGLFGERGFSIAVAPGGEACLTGDTFSTNLPVSAGAFDPTYNGAFPTSDAFVMRLAADGGSRVFSTYLGSTTWDSGRSIAVDDAGACYVTGTTEGNFPTTAGALMTSKPGGSNDGFVAKFDALGARIYSTYLGGGGFDAGWGIAVDASHAAYITGSTSSANFPVTQGAFDTSYAADVDIFVAKLLPEGRALAYATYLSTLQGGEAAHDIVVDRAGSASIVGTINYPFYPVTPDADQPNWSGDTQTGDAVLTKLDPIAAGLVYSSHFEGTGGDYPGGIAIDGQGGTYLAGYTYSSDLPVTAGAYQTVRSGDTDGFIARFDQPIAPWTTLAGGSHGAVDVPGLTGFGPLTTGSITVIALRGAAPVKNGLLLAGFTAINLPFAGGVAVPAPDILLNFVTSPSGSLDLVFPWPAAVPAGLEVFLQAWVLDPAGVSGKSSSNTVRASVP
jgi:hypothetical protein